MNDPHRLPIVDDKSAKGHVSAAVRPSTASTGEGVDDAAGRPLMQVGDLARESGKTVRAIHLYEELSLLHPTGRSKGRYRLYDHHALARIRWISKLQELGFSLPELQAVLHDLPTDAAVEATHRLQALYAQKLAETRSQIERLRALEAELLHSLSYLHTCGDVCESTRVVTQCNTCNLHPTPEPVAVPELVAGFRAQFPELPRPTRRSSPESASEPSLERSKTSAASSAPTRGSQTNQGNP
jgi:DNA-binding transcriptional MerR regulator